MKTGVDETVIGETFYQFFIYLTACCWTVESLLKSGCGQICEATQDGCKKVLLSQFSSCGYSQKPKHVKDVWNHPRLISLLMNTGQNPQVVHTVTGYKSSWLLMLMGRVSTVQ